MYAYTESREAIETRRRRGRERKNDVMTELAYIQKAGKRGKNRKARITEVAQWDNLLLADKEASKGKARHKGVRIHRAQAESDLKKLQAAILGRTYRTSEGRECELMCPCGKKRLLHKLPYYPDHICHHALMQVMFPVLMKAYYVDSAASIKGRGMHYAARRLRRYIDENGDAERLYYVKLDFTKFYHNISQRKIYGSLAKKFGDSGVRYLIHEAVTACKRGLGIGHYTIQPFVNYYTSALCREIQGTYKVRLLIYCDDMVIIGRNKHEVRKAYRHVQRYAARVMGQAMHKGVGIQVVDERHFVDFVGYRFYLTHTALRKRMAVKFKRKMHRLTDPMRRYEVANAYRGWLRHCDGFNLWKKIMGMKSFKELQIPERVNRDAEGKRIFEATRTPISALEGRELTFLDAEFDVKSKFEGKTSTVVMVEDGLRRYKFFTSDANLKYVFECVVEQGAFPFTGKIVRRKDCNSNAYTIE